MKFTSVFSVIWQKVFNGLRAITAQSYIEANVKRGVQYYFNHEFAGVAVGATRNFVFTTGAKPVIIKVRRLSFSRSTKVEYTSYEDVTFSAGTDAVIGNESRINPVPTTVAIKHTATLGVLPAGYRRLYTYGSGANTGNSSSVGLAVEGLETVLKPNTTYAVTLVNVSGDVSDIQIELSWYEGVLDLPAEE
jgi:hypothetical protein